MSNATLIKSLPIVAAAMGKKHGVKVSIRSDIDTAMTDGKNIYLPVLPATDKAVVLARGYIDHESAHIRYTDFTMSMGRGLRKQLINILEDIRIEQLLGRELPGCRINLEALERLFVEEDVYDVVTIQSHPALILMARIHHCLRVEVLDHLCTNALAQIAMEVYQEAFPPALVSRIDDLLLQAHNLRDTKHVHEVTDSILKAIADEWPKDPNQKPCQDQDQDDSLSFPSNEQSSDPSSKKEQETDDRDTGDGSDTDQDSQDQQSGDDGSSQGQDDSESDNEDGDSSDGSDTDQGSQDQQSDDGGSVQGNDDSESDNGDGDANDGSDTDQGSQDQQSDDDCSGQGNDDSESDNDDGDPINGSDTGQGSQNQQSDDDGSSQGKDDSDSDNDDGDASDGSDTDQGNQDQQSGDDGSDRSKNDSAQGKDDSTSDGDDGKAEEGGDTDQSSQNQQSGDDDSDKAGNESESDGDDGKANDGSDANQSSLNQQSGDNGVVKQPTASKQQLDNHKALLETQDDEVVNESDLGDKIAKILGDLSFAATCSGTNSGTFPEVVPPPRGRSINPSDASRETNALRTRLNGLVQASKLKRSPPRRVGHRIDTRSLHKLRTLDTRVFRAREEKAAVNTAVTILLDQSSSMNSIKNEATKAAMAVAMALDTIPGIKLSIAGFHSKPNAARTDYVPMVSPMKLSNQRIDKDCFIPYADGTTPLTEALWWASSELLSQQSVERRIVISVTDGEPDDQASVAELVEKMKHASIENHAIGIGVSIKKSLFASSCSITNIAELPERVFAMLQDMLVVR